MTITTGLGRVLRGTGDRGLALAEAARLRQMATAVESDIRAWSEHMPDVVTTEATARVARHRAEADALMELVARFDRGSQNLTPGERDSFVGGAQ